MGGGAHTGLYYAKIETILSPAGNIEIPESHIMFLKKRLDIRRQENPTKRYIIKFDKIYRM